MFNIEIKAKCDNIDETELKAREMSDNGEKTIIFQNDTFFNVLNSENNGRLKLRQYKDGSGVLVYYERPDKKGPKASEYNITCFKKQSFKEMYDILKSSNGILGEVKKVRHLYMVGQTRIHIDRVSGLGDYVELEVVLKNASEIALGTQICNDIMNRLGIKDEMLISGAYFDLLCKK